jgi:hypothetical protein
MRLPEDGPICGPKHVATTNKSVRFFIFIIVVLTAKYQSLYEDEKSEDNLCSW